MALFVEPPPPQQSETGEPDPRRSPWSAFADLLLRKHGVLTYGDSGLGESFAVLPWGGMTPPRTSGWLLEGPVGAGVAAELAIQTEPRSAQTLYLYGGSGRSIGPIAYSGWRLRTRDPATGARSTQDFQPEDPRLHTREISFQTMVPGGDWTPALYAATAPTDQSSERMVVGLSDGRRLVLGVPLLDCLCSLLVWPPFPTGYSGLTSTLVPATVETWLINTLLDHATAAGARWARLDPWPDGHRWAVTIRHDYDRLLTDRQLARRLDHYERLGTASTWFLLVQRCLGRQARMIHGRGHEVGLHTTAESEARFGAEAGHVADETGVPVSGVTAHGGDAIGFLGSRQYDWAEQFGLRYSETIGRVSEFPGRRIVGDDPPREGRLALMATHRGVDAGMRPEQHNRDSLINTQATLRDRRAHFVVMNHPDVHQQELDDVLASTRDSDAWDATLAQVTHWWETVRDAATVEGDCAAIRLPAPSDYAFGVEHHRGDGIMGRLQAVRGSDSVALAASEGALSR